MPCEITIPGQVAKKIDLILPGSAFLLEGYLGIRLTDAYAMLEGPSARLVIVRKAGLDEFEILATDLGPLVIKR